jgi:thymidine kinase
MYGKLVVITGPMFSGKTSWVIACLQKKRPMIAGVACKKPAVYAHILDMGRYSQQAKLVSHDKVEYPATWLSNAEARLWLSNIPIKEHDWWIFDEAQFLSDGLLLPLCKKVLESGMNVCVMGLAQDSFGNPFGDMGQIMAIADKVVLLSSVCEVCGGAATKTYRKAKNDAVIHVGDANDYAPRCLKHWTEQ